MARDNGIARLQADVAALRASFEAEVKRTDQVAKLREESVGKALVSAEKAVAAALAAADKATDKAEGSTRESFAKVNEFRGALDDLGKTMATRRELEDYKKTMDQSVDAMKEQIVVLGSRLDTAPETRALETRANIAQGQGTGISQSINFTHIIITIILAAVGLYLSTR